MNVYLNGKAIRLTPSQAIAKGGEADIFKLSAHHVLKLFKPPNHTDYSHHPAAQQAAHDRLAEHQIKLRQFPSSLPNTVIQPEILATDRTGHQILGYQMRFLADALPLLRYGDRSFRQSAGISAVQVIQIFQHLYRTVCSLHQAGVVIGDFNDLNVLIKHTQAWLIDADSYQFGSFLCRVYTTKFVDPLLCDPTESKPILQFPHGLDSDWYAFTVMLMQCLLFVDPYGGVYKPTQPSQKIPQEARSLHRITIFHPEVRYPKPAIPYHVLSDDLLHYFHQVFERDRRGLFPESLLQNLRWTRCLNCGQEHGRDRCPHCTPSTPKPIPSLLQVIVRGTVTVTPIFRTEGIILATGLHTSRLHWLYHDQHSFKRDDGSEIFTGNRHPQYQYWIQGTTTFVGKQGQVIQLQPHLSPDCFVVDSCGDELGYPAFAVNTHGRYWCHNGQLLRDGRLGAEFIGDVLLNQTHVWVGEFFGLGFYRASNLSVAFVFDAKRPGINDRLSLSLGSGQLLHSHCIFSRDRAWFFWAMQEQGNTYHRCAVILANGHIEAIAQASPTDGSWLATLPQGCAINQFLLVPTDDGIVRVETRNDQIQVTKTFPDTEPWVDNRCQLLPAAEGLYVIHKQRIEQLAIA